MKSLFSSPSLSCRANYSTAIIALLLLAFPTLAATRLTYQTKDSNIETLIPGKTIEREMAGGKWHKYQIPLEAGQYLRVEVMQKGVDVILKLFGPDGKQVIERDCPNGMVGPETLSHIAATGGVYHIEVRTFVKRSDAGRYLLQVETPRLPTAMDKRRVIVEQTLAEINESILNRDKAAKLKAIEGYQNVAVELREIGDKYLESLVISLIGGVKQAIGETKNALDLYDQALQISKTLSDKSLEARLHGDIGSAYVRGGEMKKGLESYKQSLALAQLTGNRAIEASVLNEIGHTYYALGDQKQALDNYNKALSLVRGIGYKFLESITVSYIADIQYKKPSQNEK